MHHTQGISVSGNSFGSRRRRPRSSIIIASGQNLLAGRPQQNGVFVLCSVTALDITEWRVRIDNAKITQVLQRYQILGLVEPIQPAATECKCAEVAVNDRQQLLRLIHPEVNHTNAVRKQ